LLVEIDDFNNSKKLLAASLVSFNRRRIDPLLSMAMTTDSGNARDVTLTERPKTGADSLMR
jgi:hypothetical protein